MLLYEDNQAAAEIIQSGKFPTLRHVQRTHGIKVTWLADEIAKQTFLVVDCHTNRMAADFLTKYFI